MGVLFNASSISKSFGARLLFENISFGLSDGDRLGLIGPNGSGKSTLMQILAGKETADDGVCSLRKLTRLAHVPQESTFTPGLSIREVLEQAIADSPIPEDERDTRLHLTLGRTGFIDAEVEAQSLSGGWKKRLAIAAELVKTPDVLLLDEPTNHLDLEGIRWLEELLQSAPFACMVISHDRYFLENVVTHMAEINRTYPDGLFYVKGNYSEFLEKKDAFLTAQAKQQEALQTVVKREIEWLRRGAKARTGKSRARTNSALELIGDLKDLNARTRTSTAAFDFTATDRKTKRLLTAENLSVEMGGRQLFKNLNVVLGPGMRLGLVGANGSGKTTLLRLFEGSLQPTSGTIERANVLRTVYFEQARTFLDPKISLRQALCPDGDSVVYQERTIHVNSWARRFLFDEDSLQLPVGNLSGGERARVHIAQLMLQQADLLLLDEPTNDLDISTLEVLEDTLLEFAGAMVLVTHDRYLLDRVSTTVMGLDGLGGAQQFADYSQWEQAQADALAASKAAVKEAAYVEREVVKPKKKLSYKEQREFEGMEAAILSAETELERLQALMHDPVVAVDAVKLHEAYEKSQVAQLAVESLYARWAELEGKLV